MENTQVPDIAHIADIATESSFITPEQIFIGVIIGIITAAILGIIVPPWRAIITRFKSKICDACRSFFRKKGNCPKQGTIEEICKKTDILCVYKNQDEAKKDMLEDAKTSSKIYAYSMYEVMLSALPSEAFFVFDNPSAIEKNPFYDVLKEKESGDVKILIMHPDSPFGKIREKELNKPNLYTFANEYIKSTLELENSYNVVGVLLHFEFPRYKFYIFDDSMYLGFRVKGETSEQNSQIYKVKGNSCLYKAFRLQFEDLWEKWNTEEQKHNYKATAFPKG